MPERVPLARQRLRCRPHDWSVLTGGNGPLLLFLHGAGASADSLSGVMERLAAHYRVVAPDLPGHGATRAGTFQRSGISEMAEDVAALVLGQFGAPRLIVGHSAGGALALALDASLSPRGHVLINASLDPFEGAAGWAFPALARALAALPGAASALSLTLGRPPRIAKLLNATGSAVSADMASRYLALARDPLHIRGTLAMMASWDVRRLDAAFGRITAPVLLVAAENDGTVSPQSSIDAARRLAHARCEIVPGGHLVHEETPDRIAAQIAAFLGEIGDA